jgi:hypothetical protein
MATRQQIDSQITLLTRRVNEITTLISTINEIIGAPPYGYTDAGEAVFQYFSQEIGFQDLQGDLTSLTNEQEGLEKQIADLSNDRNLASADITNNFNTGSGNYRTSSKGGTVSDLLGAKRPPYTPKVVPPSGPGNYQYTPEPIPTQTVLRDYRHAARIFVDDQYRLSPKYGFLFYVEFDFNPLITNISDQTLQYKGLGQGNVPARELGMLVKSATLPKFTIDTKTYNAYNRKNIVQNSIKYDPVQISFHDDQSDNVRNFWYDYYSFFFRDPDYADATYNTPHKYASRASFDWGYSPRRPSVGANLTGQQAYPYQYIQAIRIYSLYQKNFSEYQLVNPTITAFKHGDHVNGETSLLSHEMTIQYETVKYLTGYVTKNNVGGFVDLHYDNNPSPLGNYHGGPGKVPNRMGGYADIPDQITDLAGISPLYTDAPFQGPPGVATSGQTSVFGRLFGTGTSLSAGVGGTNAGGFSVPSLGSLTQGITNAAQVQQQIQAQAANIVGGVVSSAANGLIGGLAAGLGQNGGATINLIAAAIQNPQAALATVTNMAATYAMQQVGSYVTELTQPLINTASGWIKDQVGDLVGDISKVFGDIGGEVSARIYESAGGGLGFTGEFP